MRGKKVSACIVLCFVAVCLSAGTAVGQETVTSTEVKNGEVLSVNGNVLLVRGPEGVKEFTVPDDFVFNMDGRQLSVYDLKAGMKITAVVKTTETPVEMFSTEVRRAEVVHTIGTAVILRGEDGELRKYTIKDMKARNVVFYRRGEEISSYDLKKGDRISATVVTKLPPEMITETEMDVFVRENPKPVRVAQTRPAPRRAPAPAPVPVPATLPKTGSRLPLVGLAGLLALAVGVGLTIARRFPV